ncbi:uncharacterized protein N7482_003353 [Penicillium canariense]|uniref:Uncharacterized protein n=1 Tax=Penicillium canariense TaxID=189055 RepID=A0A9W9I4C3_9EURO|nr:uncharacterized protein N7482_003353 [Penicillium canariense]KAJ5167759.1 hypothetical protein N7482_003353 [Penicillium canariense]
MMAYDGFRQLHPELEDLGGPHQPAFHDAEGVAVYEAPYQELLAEIVRNNDVPSLHLYNASPHTKVFLGAYEAYYYHPFLQAAECGSFDALKALLEIYLADPTLPEPLETYLERIPCSPINDACYAANRDLMLWLLQHDPPLAKLHNRDKWGETPLFSAARALSVDGVHGVISTRNQKRDQFARAEDFICFLLDQGCSVPNSNTYVQCYGAKKPSHLDQPLAEVRETVLGAAIPHASYQMVSRLIAEGADVHARQYWLDQCSGIDCCEGVTALHMASFCWNIEGMQALVDHRGEVTLAEIVSISDSVGRLPLHWALKGDRHGRMERDGKNDQEEITALMTRTVKMLIEANPNTVNARDHQGATAFHYAVISDAGLESILPVVKLLLGAKPLLTTMNARNHRGMTALEVAMAYRARRGRNPDGLVMELVDIFLRNGADGRACNSKGQNLLHTMAMTFRNTGCSEIAILNRLLEFVDVNDADTDGRTPLHCLVRHLNRINAIRHLISHGAQVNVADKKGNTPLHDVMYGNVIQGLAGIAESETMTSDRLVKAREEMIQALVEAGASMDSLNASGQTPTQLLDEVTEMINRNGVEAFRRVAWRRYPWPGPV